MGLDTASTKRVCLACHRPFDPTSPGATATMGPTCAKRSADQAANPSQLSMLSGMDLEMSEVPAVAPTMSTSKHRRTTRAELPAKTQEIYLLAKMAFAEIYRLYCNNGTLKYGDAARWREQELIPQDFAAHTLQDPLLPWLEPEHDVCLLVDHEARMIYLRRTVNGETSFLEISFDAEGPVLQLMNTITAFTHAMRTHRYDDEVTQLSLVDQMG